MVPGNTYVLQVRTSDSYRASELEEWQDPPPTAADTAMRAIASILIQPEILVKPTLVPRRRSN